MSRFQRRPSPPPEPQPCPCCAADATVRGYFDFKYVQCSGACGLRGPTGSLQRDAVERWNRLRMLDSQEDA